jgi:hypothetical protein
MIDDMAHQARHGIYLAAGFGKSDQIHCPPIPNKRRDARDAVALCQVLASPTFSHFGPRAEER